MDLLLSILDWTNDILGLIGARLGWVQYFYPEVADQWEQWIDDLQFKFSSWGDSFTRSHFFETLLTINIPLILYLLSIPVRNASPLIDPVTHPWYIWGIFILIMIPTLGGLFLYFLSWSIEKLNAITDGDALGAVGLILIIFGLSSSGIDKLVSFIFEY